MAKFHFGANLRRVRKTKTEISQEALGMKIGITQSQISKIERRRQLPEDDMIHQMAAYLGVGYTELVPEDAEFLEEEDTRSYSLTKLGMFSYWTLLGVAAFDFTQALWEGLELTSWVTKIGLGLTIGLLAFAFLRWTKKRL